jgi:hypothetical protein
MHRILIWPDIRPAGYPANLKTGYRISSRISGEAGYWISGWILGPTQNSKIVIVKYHATTPGKSRLMNISLFEF